MQSETMDNMLRLVNDFPRIVDVLRARAEQKHFTVETSGILIPLSSSLYDTGDEECLTSSPNATLTLGTILTTLTPDTDSGWSDVPQIGTAA